MHKAGFDVARNAVKAAAKTQAKGETTGATKVYTQLTGPKGQVYLIEDSNLGRLQMLNTELAPVNFAGLVMDNMPTTDAGNNEWKGWMAIIKEEGLEPKASVNWKDYTNE
ncbi:hypothetical protein C0993_002748, partial [Termitomyces sp. T159_Od127]